MTAAAVLEGLRSALADLRTQALFKEERALHSPQGAYVRVGDVGGPPVLNLCANNYLGLADHEGIVKAAHAALDRHGFGMASVRFICGTHAIHRALEERISRYVRTEDTILFSSCFDANTGLFEALLSDGDAIVSDELNHASIIDGIRMSKARRYRYANNNMDGLASALKEASGARARTILIATDGVFSMDGVVANLPAICDLAERHGALVMVDDSHAVGFIGEGGRGTPTLHGVADRVHILTGTLGKALGGACGGYVSGRAEIVTWLRQRARPYLFSNALMPAICEVSMTAIDLAEKSPHLRAVLQTRTKQLRAGLTAHGFQLGGIDHPIVPVVIGEAGAAVAMADLLIERGVLVAPFSFPVGPRGQARIRTQVSAAHTQTDIDHAVRAFGEAGRIAGVI